MRTGAILHIAALVGLSASTSIPQMRNFVRSQDERTVTPEEVGLMDLYASYTSSAPCNNGTAIGDPVTCYKNCERAEQDGAIVVGSYLGEETEFFAYIALVESRKQIIWVGRGSSTDKNWATNLKTELIPSDLVDGAKIHTGFSTAWDEISHDVLATLEEQKSKHPDYDIIVTGGSLGGAVATVAAAHIREAGYQADLYTYGSPRIGNGVLVDFITQQPGKSYRVTHRHDLVPRIPTPIIPLPDWPEYRHVSPEYWLQGEPTDPNDWPIEDIKICEGNFNFECISTPFNPIDWNLLDPKNDHRNYFGSLTCWNDEKGPVDLAVPKDTIETLRSIVGEHPI
ncbi:unnamed protein product [Clonostachys rosea f. rosea IK726]|uniref:Fungal lipase-type domain-containing protein n=2 Tax=Bionectria ochroleuca TaxID=29856 RepID=A0A0B7K0B1_BIOOC|nr:unnamed protein product [Clonostachys rosea f. rosea IK726]